MGESSVASKLRDHIGSVVRRVRGDSADAEKVDDDDLTVDELVDAFPNLFGHRTRRVRCGDGRVHVELRELEPAEVEELGQEIDSRLSAMQDIRLVDLNTITGRAIFEHDGAGVGWRYFDNIVDRAERACGLDDRAFPATRPQYPPDAVYMARQLVEAASELSAASLGTFLKAAGFEATAAEFDLAALLAFVEHTPVAREWLEEHLGEDAVDVALRTSGAFVHAVGSGPMGPAISLALQLVELRGELSRRYAWLEREESLCAVARREHTYEFRAPERPRPLPGGDVEEYAHAALSASLGGFVTGLLDTESLEASFAPLFSGLPKAARFGRCTFNADLIRLLADRGMVVMRPRTLGHLDRIDAIVVDDLVLTGAGGIDPHAENFAAAINDAKLRFAIVGPDRRLANHLAADEFARVDTDRWRDQMLLEKVQELQREGHGVALVADHGCRALLAADVGIGLHRGELPPWESDVLATDNLDDVTFVVEAIAEAHAIADESVVLAAAGAALGMLSPLGTGLEEATPSRVMLAVNVASILALGNGLRRAAALGRRANPRPADATPYHSIRGDDVLDLLESRRSGLTDEEAADRASAEESSVVGSPRLFASAVGRELMNPFTPILAGGAIVSSAVGSAADAGIVSSAIALSALIGGFERFQAERTIEDLADTERAPVTAVRDGERREIETTEVVRGDVLVVEAGDVLPADCRIVSATNLEVDESSLTGESLAVRKSARSVTASHVAERTSMLFEGTSVVAGRARAVVVAVGEDTEAARASRLADSPPDSGVEARLRDIAEMTLPVAGLSGIVLAAVGLVRGQDMTSIVQTGVGLSVASVPEGLPLLGTIAQLAAARRLAKRGIIVRNPRTIEAMGRVDVLCADKTGTLTEGRLQFHGVCNGVRRGPESIAGDVDACRLLRSAVRATPTPDAEAELPHATDRAVLAGAASVGLTDDEWEAEGHLPFGPDRAFHAVVGSDDGERCLHVKGAPETVLPRCDVEDDEVVRLRSEAEELAAEGLRVLCVASKRMTSDGALDEADVSDLRFRGFITLSDPIRPTSAAAIRQLREVGIRTIMITGDHPQTAVRIAHEAGLDVDDANPDASMVTGADIDRLSDAELAEALDGASIVARATPVHKVRIVRVLQEDGHAVAMTGDGGNDASAIRLADIGIALGRDATRAARHAADMIVVDSHLETIVDGIAEGRAMWPSVRDAVSILVGGNLGEIGFTVASGIVSKRPALNTRQILLVNLLTDIAPALAIALRPPTAEERAEQMREDIETALGSALEEEIVRRAIVTAGGASIAWTAAKLARCDSSKASTVALLALVGSQLGQTLVAGARTRETLIASLGSAAVMLAVAEMPGISQLFGCRPVGPIGLGIAAGSTAAATAAAKFGPGLMDRFRDKLEELVDGPGPGQHDRRPQPNDSGDNVLRWPFGGDEPLWSFGG